MRWGRQIIFVEARTAILIIIEGRETVLNGFSYQSTTTGKPLKNLKMTLNYYCIGIVVSCGVLGWNSAVVFTWLATRNKLSISLESATLLISGAWLKLKWITSHCDLVKMVRI
jgi:hypothetical protein